MAQQVRVTFNSDAAGLKLNHASIGLQSSAEQTTAAPVELLFSGSSGFNIGANTTITSDWTTIPVSSSTGTIANQTIAFGDAGWDGYSVRIVVPIVGGTGGASAIVIADCSTPADFRSNAAFSTGHAYYQAAAATYNQSAPSGVWTDWTRIFGISLVETGFGAGVSGGARLFNGTTDKIDCGTNALLCPTSGGVTYAGWIKPNSPTAYDGPFGSYAGNGVGLFVKSDGKLAVYAGSSVIYDGTGTATLSNGVWYHFAATFDNTSKVGIGYLNGAQDGTGTGSFALITTTFLIGFSSAGGAPFHGTVADVGVWNVVLTAGEVAALAKGARPNTIRRASLQGYWPVDGLSSPEPDFSGNKFNGTVTGTTLVSGPPIMLFTPRRPIFTAAAVTSTFPWAWAQGSNLPVLGTGNY